MPLHHWRQASPCAEKYLDHDNRVKFSALWIAWVCCIRCHRSISRRSFCSCCRIWKRNLVLSIWRKHESFIHRQSSSLWWEFTCYPNACHSSWNPFAIWRGCLSRASKWNLLWKSYISHYKRKLREKLCQYFLCCGRISGCGFQVFQWNSSLRHPWSTISSSSSAHFRGSWWCDSQSRFHFECYHTQADGHRSVERAARHTVTKWFHQDQNYRFHVTSWWNALWVFEFWILCSC